MQIPDRYLALKKEILDIKQNVISSSPPVTLLAASKTQPAEAIALLIRAGLTDFGENRVQEAEKKWPELKKHYPDVRLHLIGPLQSNKAKAALALFDVIQTLDRPKLAEAIAGIRDAGCSLEGKRFFIQVNTGEESQKAGIAPKDADAFIDYCVNKLALPVVGLMCIPPADQLPAPHFALLGTLAKRNGLQELSMGMSGDYATAIRMGSTLVRIGSKLFGERL